MEQLFVTPAGALMARWEKAFPRALVVSGVAEMPAASTAARAVIWLDISALPPREKVV